MARRLSVSSKWTVIHDRVLRVGSMCDPRHPTTKIRDRLILCVSDRDAEGLDRPNLASSHRLDPRQSNLAAIR